MRPILLGMNNPISSRPEYALWPFPEGCTGWRLWKMLNERTGATKGQYTQAFDRRNLLPSRIWTPRAARAAAAEMLPTLVGRTVVVLGAWPRDALNLEPHLVHPIERDGVVWRQLPHPSGRNLWYNDAHNREVAAVLLEELYVATNRGEASRCT